jgi:hypothetical protein
LKEAFFHGARSDLFQPSRLEYDDEITLEIQAGRLRDTGEEIMIEPSDPGIQDVLERLDELKCLVQNATPAFKKSYKQQYRELLDYNLRPFWERWLGL